MVQADLVVVCPSNPYVSIDPILSLDGVADGLAEIKRDSLQRRVVRAEERGREQRVG